MRGGFGREERLLAVQDAGRHQQDPVRGDQCGLRLQQVGTVDGKEDLILFHIVADLGEQPIDSSLIIGEDLDRHVLVVIDIPYRAFLDCEQAFADGLDLDRSNLLLGEVHGVGGSRFTLDLGRSRFTLQFRVAADQPSEIRGRRKDYCADAYSHADASNHADAASLFFDFMNVPRGSPRNCEFARAQTLPGHTYCTAVKLLSTVTNHSSTAGLVIPMRNRPALALWATKVRRRNQGPACVWLHADKNHVE